MKKNGYSHENRQNKSFFLGNYHRDGVCIALGGLTLSSEDSRASSTHSLPIFTYWIKCQIISNLLFFNHPTFNYRNPNLSVISEIRYTPHFWPCLIILGIL